MATKRIDNSSKHATFRSIEVVEDGDSKNVTEIKTLQITMAYAQADRNSLRAAIENISLDAVITPAEKVWLQEEWDKIVSDHAVIVSDAGEYGLAESAEYTAYVAAYNALSSYITPILNTPEEETSILQVQYNTLFDKYFISLDGVVRVIVYSQISTDLPSYEDITTGFDAPAGAASTTPTVPTIEAEPVSGGIQLKVDKQINLKYLDHYDFQVSEDGVNWYAFGTGGSWYSGGPGGFTSWELESVVHPNIPSVQLEVLGTWTVGSDIITIGFGTGQLREDDAIAGMGIPAGATIIEVLSNTQIQISVATSASGVGAALLIGDDIDGTGDNKKYMGRRLYYRARRVTVAELSSSWSSMVYAQAGQAQVGFIAAHSLLVNMLEVGFLEAGFAKVKYELVMGYAGVGDVDNPQDKDRKIYMDRDEITFQQFLEEAWKSAGMKLGGTDENGYFIPFFQGKGVFHPEADILNVSDMGDIPPKGFLFRFDDDMVDATGTYTFGRGSLSSVWSKYGGSAITNAAAGAGLALDSSDPNFGDFSLKKTFGISFWFYRDSASLYESNTWIFYYQQEFDDDTLITVYLRYDRSDSGLGLSVVYEGISLTDYDAIYLTEDEAHYICLYWDTDEAELLLVVDNVTVSTLDISSVLNSAEPTTFEMWPLFSHLEYVDELLFAPGERVSLADLSAHYTYGKQWAKQFSDKDIIIRPKSGGKVALDGPVVATGDAAIEGVLEVGEEIVSPPSGIVIVDEAQTLDLSKYKGNIHIIADTSTAEFTLTLSNALPEYASLKLTVLDGETGNKLTLIYAGPGGSVTMQVTPFSTWGSQEYLSTGSALIPTRGVFILWSGSTSGADITWASIVGNTGLDPIGDYEVITFASGSDYINSFSIRSLSVITEPSTQLTYVQADSSGFHVYSASAYLMEIRRRL